MEAAYAQYVRRQSKIRTADGKYHCALAVSYYTINAETHLNTRGYNHDKKYASGT